MQNSHPGDLTSLILMLHPKAEKLNPHYPNTSDSSTDLLLCDTRWHQKLPQISADEKGAIKQKTLESWWG